MSQWITQEAHATAAPAHRIYPTMYPFDRSLKAL